MAEQYFPFTAGLGASVTDNQWEIMARNFRRTGVAGDTSNISLKVSASSNTLTSTVGIGEAFLVGHQYVNDAPQDVAHDPNTSGFPRIDVVAIRRDLPQQKLYPVVIKGTPSANPTPPTLQGNFNGFSALEMPGDLFDLQLAQVRIENNAAVIPSTSYTDVRWFSGIEITTGTGKNINNNWGMRPMGSLHFQSDTRRWMAWDGVKWSIIHETGPWRTFQPKVYWNLSSGLVQSSTWKTNGRYRYTADNTIEFAVSVQATANMSIPSGEGATGPMQISLPFNSGNYAAGNDHILNAVYVPGNDPSKARSGVAYIWPNSAVINQIWTNHVTSSPDSQTGTLDQLTNGYTHPTGTTLRISGCYETAGA